MKITIEIDIEVPTSEWNFTDADIIESMLPTGDGLSNLWVRDDEVEIRVIRP